MPHGLREDPLDWFAEPFFPDGAVDWEAARKWVGDVHTALAGALGPDTWTDAHAGWLGRFAHDTLRFQGVSLAEATPEDVEDLLFTLQPAQRDAMPGPPELAVDTLLHFFRFGVEHHGAVGCKAALDWLDADDTALLFVAAMSDGGLTRKQKRALLNRGPGPATAKKKAGRTLPKRKKGKKKRR